MKNTLCQYVKTERAHFMCPNMHFGIQFELPKIYDKKRIVETCDKLSSAHSFLRAVMAFEEGTEHLYYDVTLESKIDIVFKDTVSLKDYEDIDESKWDIFKNGLLKVFCSGDERTTTVLFVVHHLLADGKGALTLAEEFANFYVGDVLPNEVMEHLLSDISDLPEGSSMNGIGKWLFNYVNRKWKKEGKKLDYKTYRELVRQYCQNHEVKRDVILVTTEQFDRIRKVCKDNDVTVNDVLLAQMFLTEGCNKIIVAADIREKIKNYNIGALGNYASAFTLELKSKTNQVGEKAKEVHNLVKKKMADTNSLMTILACYFIMDPTLLDAAAMAGVGLYDSKAAAFVGKKILGYSTPSAYSITNLGKISNKNMNYATFIPPASPAAKKMLGVVTVNGQMVVCSSINKKR